MKIPIVIFKILKCVIMPICAIGGISVFNLFEYFSFIPEEYQYETGLAAYLAIMEVALDSVKKYIDSQRSNIECIFYKSEIEKDNEYKKISPIAIFDSEMDIANINVCLSVSGDIKYLRKCKLQMEIPSWLTAQTRKEDDVLEYNGHLLIWNLSKLLPRTGSNRQNACYKSKISLIKNNHNNISINLEPQIKIEGYFLKRKMIVFKTNGFKVQSGV